MSYYYCYYVGYEKDGLIYPLGPYDAFGKLRPTVCKSRSFASKLHERFKKVPVEKASDELKKEFTYEDWNGEDHFECKYLPLKELPRGSYIKSGYYLTEDVQAYNREPYDFDGFYDYVDPVVYNAMVNNELRFGRPPMEKDCEGNEYRPRSASDYMYFAYPDWESEEFESQAIRNEADALWNYEIRDCTLVALETEG